MENMAIRKRRKKNSHFNKGLPKRLTVSSVAKLIGLSMHEVHENAKYFKVTPTEIVARTIRQRVTK